MTWTYENPSPGYLKALEESRKHHRVHKTWSGGLMTRHVERIKSLIAWEGCEDALDYGCGKCLQYITPMEDGRSVEEFLGIPIYKMDPAVTPDFRRPANMPRDYRIAQTLPADQQWDLVICTHVLGSLPTEDLRDWAVPLLHARARKAIYVAENLSIPHKNPFSTTADKPRVWTAAQWMELLEIPGSPIKVEAWFRGTPGVGRGDPNGKGPGFRKWPFEE